jgi:hypothetical protein
LIPLVEQQELGIEGIQPFKVWQSGKLGSGCAHTPTDASKEFTAGYVTFGTKQTFPIFDIWQESRFVRLMILAGKGPLKLFESSLISIKL